MLLAVVVSGSLVRMSPVPIPVPLVQILLGAWIGAVGAKTAYIEPGSPWENGYCESINSKLGERGEEVRRDDQPIDQSGPHLVDEG